MTQRIYHSQLAIDPQLYHLVVDEILPGLNLDAAHIWQSLAQLLEEFQPRNQALLHKRDVLQQRLNHWHQTHTYDGADPASRKKYQAFLQELGYLIDAPDKVTITSTNIDDEIAHIAGPQLVVPVDNARYAINAANARWGSLYDAIYGTDVLGELPTSSKYDAERGAKVIAFGKTFLDTHFPLQTGSHSQVEHYAIDQGQLVVKLNTHQLSTLKQPQCVGYRGTTDKPTAILLHHHHLHVELSLDAHHPVGQQDLAGLADIVLESALSVIMDCEDSVAAVDAEDKTRVYKNWLGLMQADLTTQVLKQGKMTTRRLNQDRHYKDMQDQSLRLHGRALMFIRNVGHLMTSDAILNAKGEAIPEGIMDGFFTSLCALHDLNKSPHNIRNSRTGSIYIVKPKMHGPEEVQFSVDLFSRIEQQLGLPAETIKIGIMDEERRTSVNLKACIQTASKRLAFINTGFLDRTGDEIHTSMVAGPVVAKDAMKQHIWIKAYEDNNVLTGLACGLQGRAQIGKGMWAKPDCMLEMLNTKVEHPKAGASTAWVPSPTAATLHAIHYHEISVIAQQAALHTQVNHTLDDLLTLPLLDTTTELSQQHIAHTLDNNCQSILGYVVRWVEQGIGCSKVPDLNQVGLMEDRATLRISAQFLANWLNHGLFNQVQLIDSMQRMAVLVDQQNAHNEGYRNMAPHFDNSLGFQAALELVLKGKQQPNGYTEPVLHRLRREAKERQPKANTTLDN